MKFNLKKETMIFYLVGEVCSVLMFLTGLYYCYLIFIGQESPSYFFLVFMLSCSVWCITYIFYSFFKISQYSFVVNSESLLMIPMYGNTIEIYFNDVDRIKKAGAFYREIHLKSGKSVLIHDGVDNFQEFYSLLESKIRKC